MENEPEIILDLCFCELKSAQETPEAALGQVQEGGWVSHVGESGGRRGKKEEDRSFLFSEAAASILVSLVV